jgi:hypothetical protein
MIVPTSAKYSNSSRLMGSLHLIHGIPVMIRQTGNLAKKSPSAIIRVLGFFWFCFSDIYEARRILNRRFYFRLNLPDPIFKKKTKTLVFFSKKNPWGI